MFKKILFYTILIYFVNLNIVNSKERKKIVDNLNKINSIKFNFVQETNNNKEFGFCTLLFPNKIKCVYEDNNQKELIVNNERLAITQKRYNKTSYYSISKSPFKKILNKKELIKIINLGEIEIVDKKIYLTYVDKSDQEILITFDKNNFDLMGWTFNDQFNNYVNFSINILLKNILLKEKDFKIPVLN